MKFIHELIKFVVGVRFPTKHQSPSVSDPTKYNPHLETIVEHNFKPKEEMINSAIYSATIKIYVPSKTSDMD